VRFHVAMHFLMGGSVEPPFFRHPALIPTTLAGASEYSLRSALFFERWEKRPTSLQRSKPVAACQSSSAAFAGSGFRESLLIIPNT
jgi:hypothetical protein